MQELSGSSFTDRSFIKTRYTTDKRISNSSAAKLYGAWLLESARGNFADTVLVAAEDETPIGFVACKIEESIRNGQKFKLGIITLNAVTESKRAKGVFSSILEEALGWFESRVEAVILCSQLTNVGVHKACIRLGANLDSSHITLHKWI
jgi:hypothetical protein